MKLPLPLGPSFPAEIYPAALGLGQGELKDEGSACAGDFGWLVAPNRGSSSPNPER